MLYRTAKLNDIPQLLKLMNDQYARKKNENYFLWQYFNSIYPTVVICAEFEEKIIGMFGLQKRRLKNGLIGGQAIDMLIHPKYRNQGIFFKLGKIAFSFFDDLDFLFVLPNLNGKNAILKNFDFNDLLTINNLILFAANYNKTNIQLDNNLITNIYEFDYTKQIQQWRFTNHPDYEYTKIKINEANHAFVKIFIDPVTYRKYGDIVYFESYESFALHKLILKCCDSLFAENVSIITTWSLPDTSSTSILNEIGFTEMAQERYFCLKPIKSSAYELSNNNKWSIFQSDVEFF